MSIFKSTVFVFSLVLFIGCGEGGSSGNSGTVSSVTGTFVDDPVKGLSYKCSSGNSNQTDIDGKYTCNTGDNVTFSINGVTIGTIAAQTTVISPYSLFPNDNAAALNLGRLLQSINTKQTSGIIDVNTSLEVLIPSNTNFANASFETTIETALSITLVSEYEAQTTMNTAITAVGGSVPTDLNHIPVANAGMDQNVTTTSVVTLDGSSSSDADLDTLTYTWNIVSKPTDSSATLSSVTVLNPTFTADVGGQYVLSLVVNDGTLDSAADTVTIMVLPVCKQVAVAPNHSVCLKSDGTIWSWGFNLYGQLGDGTNTSSYYSVVQEATKSTSWASISAGRDYTVAMKNDGTLWAWGYNFFGQLGNNSTANSNVPVQEATQAKDWLRFSAGVSTVAAIKTNYTLWSWGNNQYGEIGDGTTIDRTVPTQEATKATNWYQVTTGGWTTIAIKANRTLFGWGSNVKGQIGDGTNTNRSIPTQEVTKATDWISATSGAYSSAAIKSNGTLWAWGGNSYGELGDGSPTIQVFTPIQEVTKATNWKEVSMGNSFTVALKTDNTLWGWGRNHLGQLATNTLVDSYIPIQESSSSTDWKSLAISASGVNNTSIAIKNNNIIYGTGANSFGNIGEGTTTSRENYTHSTILY